jgi:hypothetical protein
MGKSSTILNGINHPIVPEISIVKHTSQMWGIIDTYLSTAHNEVSVVREYSTIALVWSPAVLLRMLVGPLSMPFSQVNCLSFDRIKFVNFSCKCLAM